MAEAENRRVALLSIHPQHAEAIMSGRKRVELRRVRPSSPLSFVAVYATAPTSAIIGWFEVDGIDEASQTKIWTSYASVAGVTRAQFRGYFSGAPRAYAIRVRRAHRIDAPIPLGEVPGVARPPQSFQYLDDRAAAIVGIPFPTVAH